MNGVIGLSDQPAPPLCRRDGRPAGIVAAVPLRRRRRPVGAVPLQDTIVTPSRLRMSCEALCRAELRADGRRSVRVPPTLPSRSSAAAATETEI